MNIFRKGSATVALCIMMSGSATGATPRDAPSLRDTVMLWLVANFDLAASVELPRLVTVPDVELVAMRYGIGTAVRPGEVVAIYDGPGRRIYLSESWTGGTAAELSVLVHEMVHHLQSVSNMRFACPAEREVLAYRAQDAWLRAVGATA